MRTTAIREEHPVKEGGFYIEDGVRREQTEPTVMVGVQFEWKGHTCKPMVNERLLHRKPDVALRMLTDGMLHDIERIEHKVTAHDRDH